MKKGFTLTELLVVVLIIGVLSAIALPQYTKAVDKSRFSTLMPVANHVKDAQEAFYLSSWEYTPDLESAGVKIGTVTGNKAVIDDVSAEVTADGTDGYVTVSKEGLDNRYVMYFNRSANYPQEIHCEALSSSDRAKSLCVTMGGTELGANGSYTKYVLSGTGNGTTNSGGTGGGETTEPSTPEETPDSGQTSSAPNSFWATVEKYGWMDDNTVYGLLGSGRLNSYYPDENYPEVQSKEYLSDDTLRLTYADGSYLDLTVTSVSNPNCFSTSCFADLYNDNGYTDNYLTMMRFDTTGVLNNQEVNMVGDWSINLAIHPNADNNYEWDL